MQAPSYVLQCTDGQQEVLGCIKRLTECLGAVPSFIHGAKLHISSAKCAMAADNLIWLMSSVQDLVRQLANESRQFSALDKRMKERGRQARIRPSLSANLANPGVRPT